MQQQYNKNIYHIQQPCCMTVEYVAIRVTEDARDCINRAKLPKETMSEAIIRCCSDIQQPRDNDTTTQQLEISLFDTRKDIQDLQERYDSLQALVNSLQTTVNNAINQSVEVRSTPLISDMQQPCDNGATTQQQCNNVVALEQEPVKPDTKVSDDEEKIPVTDDMIEQLTAIIKAGIEKEEMQKNLIEKLSPVKKSVITSFTTTSQTPPKTMRKSDYDKILSYGRENLPDFLQL